MPRLPVIWDRVLARAYDLWRKGCMARVGDGQISPVHHLVDPSPTLAAQGRGTRAPAIDSVVERRETNDQTAKTGQTGPYPTQNPLNRGSRICTMGSCSFGHHQTDRLIAGNPVQVSGHTAALSNTADSSGLPQ